jgi:hypothetical protein
MLRLPTTLFLVRFDANAQPPTKLPAISRKVGRSADLVQCRNGLYRPMNDRARSLNHRKIVQWTIYIIEKI